MYSKLSIIMLFMFIAIIIYANGVKSSHIDNCEVSLVGAGSGGLYTVWRLINATIVLPNKVCIFEQTERVG